MYHKNKYEKYKNKYILLKQKIQEIQEGGKHKFIGAGSSGCLISPPVKPREIKSDNLINYQPDLLLDEINDYKYVGKILAIQSNAERDLDSYENELRQLKIIKELDENGIYTPELIYANIHSKDELLEILKKDIDVDVDVNLDVNLDSDKYADTNADADADADADTDTNTKTDTKTDTNADIKNISKCVNDKIKSPYYGYIISKHTGISLFEKYDSKYIEPDTNKLKKFLNKFNELLKFIKILYDKNFLHLDIKIDNITIKKEEDDKLYLIDFGRTLKLESEKDFDKIIKSFLRGQHYMYSFEPKIYINLLEYYSLPKYQKNQISFKDLITFISFKNNFEILIIPYDYKADNIHNILKKILEKVFYSNINEDKPVKNPEKIYKLQKNYFINYLNDCKYKYINNNHGNNENDKLEIKKLLNYIFYPLIAKYDMYCMGIVLAEIVLFKYKFDELNDIFQIKFKELIQSLLFNKFNKVDEIMLKITELIELLETDE